MTCLFDHVPYVAAAVAAVIVQVRILVTALFSFLLCSTTYFYSVNFSFFFDLKKISVFAIYN